MNSFVLTGLIAITLSAIIGSQNAYSLTETFFDESVFLSQSGATEIVTFPTMKGLDNTPHIENGVIVEQHNSYNNRIDDFSALLPDNEFVVSGPDHLDISFPNDILAFGVRMADAFDLNWSGTGGSGGVSDVCPKEDSSFTITFKKGANVIDSFAFDPPVDEAFFVGAILSEPFDNIEIREIGAPVDVFEAPFCEDDFWGDMFTSTSIPEQVIGGEIIPIEATSLILAGVQSFSWMIPAVLSGIGFGLVFLRKNNFSF